MLLKKEMTKSEIDKEMAGKGDYVQIDTLRRYLKENIPADMKKFASLKLITLYEGRSMFAEAAFIYNTLIELAANYQERMDFLIKEIEDFIRAGFFDRADAVMNKITAEMKPMEKTKYTSAIKGFYMAQGLSYERQKRKGKAIEVYEKLAGMKGMSSPEMEEVKVRLLVLYKELGLTQKYFQLSGK